MDEPAITPIRKKRRSSLRICAELVKDGRAQVMVTAGNTGAAMVAAKMVIGTVAGVDRPALAAVLPNPRGRTVLLDVGANVNSKPLHLREFAVMGHFYAQEVLGTPLPRIGLLSIGEEEGKGTDLTREVARVLKTTGLELRRQRRGRGRVQRRGGRGGLRRLRGQRGAQERRGRGRIPVEDAQGRGGGERPRQAGLRPGQTRLRPLPRARRLQRIRRRAAPGPERRLLHRPRPLQRPRHPERHPPRHGVHPRAVGPEDPRQDRRAAQPGGEAPGHGRPGGEGG